MGRRRKRVPGDPGVGVAYIRVSTEDQRLGPEAQRAAIDAWAVREGVLIAASHVDQGLSGDSALDERPGLMAAIAQLTEYKAGLLVVAKRDRLARDPYIAGAIERVVAGAMARVVSADGTGSGVEPVDQFMRTVQDGVAKYELEMIRARTRAALAIKKARGEVTGKPPFGFRASGPKGKNVPDPGEQQVFSEVDRMRRLDMTERAIVEELVAAGYRSRSGAAFAQTQVHRMIARLRSGETPQVPDCPNEAPATPARPTTMPADRLLRRKIHPLDIEVDVDLYDAIRAFGSEDGRHVDPAWIDPVVDAIERGAVILSVASVPHVLGAGWRARLTASSDDRHAQLCQCAALFLEARGKKALVTSPGHQGKYAGGSADVIARDGSVFVECGTLREDKVLRAMWAGETVLLLPYALGARIPKGLRSRFVDRDAVHEDPRVQELYDAATIQLALLFKPKGKLPGAPDPLRGGVTPRRT